MKILLLIWGFFFPYKTKKERKEIYKKIAEHLKNPPYPGFSSDGFCFALQRVEKGKSNWIGQLWRLPELYWYKPFWKGELDFWWDTDKEGTEKRIRIAEKISI
jgi:hypothetical protein